MPLTFARSSTANDHARPMIRTDAPDHARGDPFCLNNGPGVILHCNLTPRTPLSDRVTVTPSHPHTELKSP
jgi:hypothetical protein